MLHALNVMSWVNLYGLRPLLCLEKGMFPPLPKVNILI